MRRAPLRLLVLGAGGRVGRLLSRAWRDDPSVEAICQSRQPGTEPGWRQFDLLGDPGAMQAAVAEADAIVCLAGPTPVGGNAEFSATEPLALASLSHARGRPVLLMSSSTVYGLAGGHFREDQVTGRASAYGEAKRAMEAAAQASKEWNPGLCCCLRLGNVAGADQLLGGLQPGRAPVLDRFADGGYPVRCYVGPRMLATLLAELSHAALADQSLPPVLNLAATPAVSMRDLLEAAEIPFIPADAPTTAVQEYTLDMTRLASLLPHVDLHRDAKATVADWRSVAGPS